MKMVKILTVLASCLWLSGCILTPDGWWEDGPRQHHSDDGGRSFCPPGQAKKGNC